MLNEATPRNFVRDQSLHIKDTQFNEAILAGYRFIFNRLRPDCSTPGTLTNKKGRPVSGAAFEFLRQTTLRLPAHPAPV